MTPESVIAGVPIYVVEDRCFVRLEILLEQMPDTLGRAELMVYLWQRDLPGDEA